MKILLNTIEKFSYAFFISIVMSSEFIQRIKKGSYDIYNEIDLFINSNLSLIEKNYNEVGQIVMSSRDHIGSIIKFIGI